MKTNISQDTKYFCITEAIALYLQKFILYRKRKVFYGADGTNKSLFDVINKHKDNEKFLYPCSESFDSEITNWLRDHNCEYATPVLYRIISNDIREVIAQNFDVICLFTPGGVRSLLKISRNSSKTEPKLEYLEPILLKPQKMRALPLTSKPPTPGTKHGKRTGDIPYLP